MQKSTPKIKNIAKTIKTQRRNTKNAIKNSKLYSKLQIVIIQLLNPKLSYHKNPNYLNNPNHISEKPIKKYY